MKKEFKRGDKVYWINGKTQKQHRVVNHIIDNKIYFVEGSWMLIEDLFHSETSVVETSIKPVKYAKFKKGDKVYWKNKETRLKEELVVDFVIAGEVWFTTGTWLYTHDIFHSDITIEPKKLPMPLFGSELIDKYRK